MEKRVLSFRVSEAEITALEALQQSEDSSLGQTAIRLLRGILGVQPDTHVNTVNADGIKDRVESLEERLNSAITSRDELTDFVNDIVDKRIQHLGDALSDHENRLLGIEQATVTPKTTTQEVAPALLQEELESAIATGEILTPVNLNKKYFICKNCSNQGYADENFKKEGKTKSGTQRWRCANCGNTRSELTIIASPPPKRPQEDTNDWKAKTANFLDGVNNQWEK